MSGHLDFFLSSLLSFLDFLRTSSNLHFYFWMQYYCIITQMLMSREKTSRQVKVIDPNKAAITTLITLPAGNKRCNGPSSQQDVCSVGFVPCYWGIIQYEYQSQFDTDIAAGNHKGMKLSLKKSEKRTFFSSPLPPDVLLLSDTLCITCVLAFAPVFFSQQSSPAPLGTFHRFPPLRQVCAVIVCLLRLGTHESDRPLLTTSHN